MTNKRLTALGSGEIQCVVFASNFSAAERALAHYKAVIVKSYPFISAFGVYINTDVLPRVLSLACIRSVTANSVVKVDALPVLNKKSRRINMFENSAKGSITAAYIDTGIEPPLDFYIPKLRLKKFVDFVGAESEPYDDNGHGTAVGCLISGDGRFTSGVKSGSAPNSELISLKAVGADGTGNVFSILEAMQWVYSNAQKYRIKVLCMSLGCPYSGMNDPLVLASRVLWKSGVTVVVSSGNGGEGSEVNSPGICREVITVGSLDFLGDTVVRSPFTSENAALNKPEIYALGELVPCVGIDGNSVVLSGTSISAPLVAGACCNILSKNEALSPDNVKQILLKGARFQKEGNYGFYYLDL